MSEDPDWIAAGEVVFQHLRARHAHLARLDSSRESLDAAWAAVRRDLLEFVDGHNRALVCPWCAPAQIDPTGCPVCRGVGTLEVLTDRLARHAATRVQPWPRKARS